MATKGYAAPEVQTNLHAGARNWAAGGGNSSALPILWETVGRVLCWGTSTRRAHELAEAVPPAAQSSQDPLLLVEAHYALGATLLQLGEFATARRAL